MQMPFFSQISWVGHHHGGIVHADEIGREDRDVAIDQPLRVSVGTKGRP